MEVHYRKYAELVAQLLLPCSIPFLERGDAVLTLRLFQDEGRTRRVSNVHQYFANMPFFCSREGCPDLNFELRDGLPGAALLILLIIHYLWPILVELSRLVLLLSKPYHTSTVQAQPFSLR